MDEDQSKICTTMIDETKKNNDGTSKKRMKQHLYSNWLQLNTSYINSNHSYQIEKEINLQTQLVITIQQKVDIIKVNRIKHNIPEIRWW